VTIRAVVFDLDGVVRHFAPTAPLEARFGIPEGAIYDAAFTPELLDPTVVGAREYDDWIRGIGDVLAERYGPHARDAATAFTELVATPDAAVVDLMRRLRTRGYLVSILTNGTTRVEAELEALALDREIDHLFNSARIGIAKPDRGIYEHVLDVLEIEAHECVFTDDSPAKCEGARAVGMHVIDFVDATHLERELRLFQVIA
jgi:putative hydrolase of the HAD superfamily